MTRQAIVLLNLGGPDSIDAVRPFLFNLFNDPAIFRLPQPIRSALAAFVAKRRAVVAETIYRHLGGASPLLPNTEAQAASLEAALGSDAKVFVAMRYWHPFSLQTAVEVEAWKPDEVLLLPLYPQFSTTTTASSVLAWRHATRTLGLDVPTRSICCYPTEEGFVQSVAERIGPLLDEAAQYGMPRLLLSAHGLPERIVRAGDPYQFQCERTAEAIVAALERPGLDWTLCYQSRVGRLKWIGPGTDTEIRRAGQDRVPLVVAPIAFVSEHSETLVEIEIDFRKLAGEVGVPYFGRAPAVGAAPAFIDALARLARSTHNAPRKLISGCGKRICPASYSGCPYEASLTS